MIQEQEDASFSPFVWKTHLFYSLVFQGYDSIPAEIPDPKAKEVS